MKCDELKRKYSDITGPYYRYNEVNEAIAELKAELAEKDEEIDKQKWRGDEWAKSCNQKDKEIESLKATHYTEMVDAGMRERKLRRALYKVCANWAHIAVAFFTSYVTKDRWRWMELKCLKKVEELDGKRL